MTRETLQGWVPPLAEEQELRTALEQAFDYRGDVTLTLKSGEMVVGYVYDRRPGKSLADSYVRVLPQEVGRDATLPTRRSRRWPLPGATPPQARAGKRG